MKKLLALIISQAVFLNSIYPYITIDTNKLIQNGSVTNLKTKSVAEEELPNSYLATGKIQLTPPELPGRRYDVVFFIAIPVTFYLTLNIMQIKNLYFFNNSLLDNVDWNYIYLNTLIIPLAVAYFDYASVEKQTKLKEEYSYYKNKDIFFSLHLPVFSFRF